MNIATPITKAVDSKRREVMVPYSLTVDGLTIAIATGFIYDGASIPRIAWRLFGHPWDGKFIPAAIVHDALYRTHLLSKKEADRLFYRLLKLNGVGRWKSWCMYKAVDCGGKKSWHKYGESSQLFHKYFVKLRKGGVNEQ